jgi:hypothetical protein
VAVRVTVRVTEAPMLHLACHPGRHVWDGAAADLAACRCGEQIVIRDSCPTCGQSAIRTVPATEATAMTRHTNANGE